MNVFEHLWKYSFKLSHLNEHLFRINDVSFEGCGLSNDLCVLDSTQHRDVG